MTDTAFLGRVGEVELGASAIAGVYYLIIFMIGFGFSIGAQILIARRNGEGRQDEIGGIFYHSIGFLLVLATIACAFSLVFSPHILQGVVTSQAVCDKAVSYINWRVLGLFFAFTSAVFRAFYVGTTRTKTLTLNSILMVLSNVVFNYILVFGNFGCPALGIAGAAIGSTLAEAVSTTFFIIYTARRTDCKRYGLDKLTQFSRKTLTGILKISTWTMIQNFFSISIWFMFFIFIEHLGEHSLAITNIVRSISSIPYMIVAAFASTCSSIVSNLIGSGNVGPLAMIPGSSPGISEIINVTTLAGAQASARRPPLISDKCFRTQFISEMLAPLRNSCLLICCFSSRLMFFAGNASNAEPPPEIRHSTRSFSVSP